MKSVVTGTLFVLVAASAAAQSEPSLTVFPSSEPSVQAILQVVLPAGTQVDTRVSFAETADGGVLLVPTTGESAHQPHIWMIPLSSTLAQSVRLGQLFADRPLVDGSQVVQVIGASEFQLTNGELRFPAGTTFRKLNR